VVPAAPYTSTWYRRRFAEIIRKPPAGHAWAGRPAGL